MWCSWTTDQPCRLVIKSPDGSFIESTQHNSFHEISHLLKSKVVISIEPIQPNGGDKDNLPSTSHSTPSSLRSIKESSVEVKKQNVDVPVSVYTKPEINSTTSSDEKCPNVGKDLQHPVESDPVSSPKPSTSTASTCAPTILKDESTSTNQDSQLIDNGDIIDLVSDATSDCSSDDEEDIGHELPTTSKAKLNAATKRKYHNSSEENNSDIIRPSTSNNEIPSSNRREVDSMHVDSESRTESAAGPETIEDDSVEDINQSNAMVPLHFDVSRKAFRYKDAFYYIREIASGRAVNKKQCIKVFRRNYIKVKRRTEIIYRCRAHDECPYTTNLRQSIHTHIFPVYFQVPCPNCNLIFRFLSNFYSHYKKKHLANHRD